MMLLGSGRRRGAPRLPAERAGGDLRGPPLQRLHGPGQVTRTAHRRPGNRSAPAATRVSERMRKVSPNRSTRTGAKPCIPWTSAGWKRCASSRSSAAWPRIRCSTNSSLPAASGSGSARAYAARSTGSPSSCSRVTMTRRGSPHPVAAQTRPGRALQQDLQSAVDVGLQPDMTRHGHPIKQPVRAGQRADQGGMDDARSGMLGDSFGQRAVRADQQHQRTIGVDATCRRRISLACEPISTTTGDACVTTVRARSAVDGCEWTTFTSDS